MTEKGYCLYARPAFSEGMARLVDVFGTLNRYNDSYSEDEADYKALLSDWETVGMDIQRSVKTMVQDHPLKSAAAFKKK